MDKCCATCLNVDKLVGYWWCDEHETEMTAKKGMSKVCEDYVQRPNNTIQTDICMQKTIDKHKRK